jgi:hypothetical protein
MARVRGAIRDATGRESDLRRSVSAVEALRERLLERAHSLHSLEDKVAEQQRQIMDLQLYLHSLLQLLVGKGVLTQSELAPFIGVIDEEEALAAVFAGSKDGAAKEVLDSASPETLLLEKLDTEAHIPDA